MPLYDIAGDLIRGNLSQFRPDVKVRVRAVIIGELTHVQLAAIHIQQDARNLPRIVTEVLFHGWHIYKQRVLQDGYSIDDVVDQVTSALCTDSVVSDPKYMTQLQNPNERADRYGNKVRDLAVLECTSRHPRPELFTVVPKGDVIKPPKK